MKLSNQAIGALMLALQKGISEQVDITGVFRDFELFIDTETDEVGISNPPTISVEKEEDA
jgi:hypothetical protein